MGAARKRPAAKDLRSQCLAALLFRAGGDAAIGAAELAALPKGFIFQFDSGANGVRITLAIVRREW